MGVGPSPGCHKAFFYALQLRGVGGVTSLKLLLHLVICGSEGIQLIGLCLSSHRLCCQVTIERHICNQTRIVSILNRLVECEVEGHVFEKDAKLFIEDVGVLREVGTMAGGADDLPGENLAIG